MTTRHLALVATAALVAACAPKENASIEAVAICTPTSGPTCGAFGSCMTSMQESFFYLIRSDGAPNLRLLYSMQFNNRLSDNSTDDGHLNTNWARIEGVNLSYTVHPTPATPAFSIPSTTTTGGTARIEANSSGTPWVDIFPVDLPAGASATYTTYFELLSTSIAAGDAVRVDVHIRGKGSLGDGTSFETGEILFPVWVYNSQFGGYTCSDPTQTPEACPVEGAGGAVVTCGTSSELFTIGGTISGLGANTGLILHCDGLSDLTVPANETTFTFAQGLPDGTAYTCDVVQSPAGLSCSMGSGTGTVSGADVTSLVVTCS